MSTKLKKILELFKSNGEYKPEDYISFSILYRQDGRYSLQLIYDYKKNPIKSNQIIVDDEKKLTTISCVLSKEIRRKLGEVSTDDLDFLDEWEIE